MSTESSKERLREAGITAWKLAILVVTVLIVLILYLGMGFLVYRNRMSAGPLMLFTGVILGYLLRSIRDWM